MNTQTQVSKFLSYILRHKPDAIDLTLDKNGWAEISQLIFCAKKHNKQLTLELILDVVKQNDKQRFSLSPDNKKIRANQGHSIPIELELESRIPPEYLYHGTAQRFLDSITQNGIHASSRHHVHLSASYDTAINVGKRYGKPVVLKIFSKKMHDAGCVFYCSENGVWLTDFVAPSYFEKID